jgi:FMN reductase (NADPH)
MNNPTIETIYQHGSVRHYKPDPVSREMIETVVRASQQASTSSNLQMLSIVALTDLEKRAQMQKYCGGQRHIGQAPVFLTWVADLSRLYRLSAARGYKMEAGQVENFLLAVVDAAIAAQNAALAAESMGLGICYIGAIRNHPREVIRLLKLPYLTFPLVGMTLGWPIRPPMIRPRLPLEAVLHWEQYNPEGEEVYLKEYDQEMIATGIYRGRQVSAADPMPVEEYGWTEHSARRISKVLRPHLREVLLEMGFELK